MRPPFPRLVVAAVLLLAALAGTARAAAPFVDGHVLVRWRAEARATDRAAVRAAAGARPLAAYPLIDAELLEVGPGRVTASVAALRADARVRWAEPDYLWHATRVPDDPLFGSQWSLENTGQTGGVPGADIHASQAWDVFTGDSTLLVGVIDTGIDYTHPDLVGNLWTNPGEIPDNGIDDDGDGYVDDVHGYDFANHDGDPLDDNGHGTHVSGIIAARGNNGRAVSGVCWRAKIVAIKFLAADGTGTSANAVAALQYATRLGIRLTNNSWGGGPFSQALLDAIDAAGAAGMLFVAAAGNSGLDTDLIPNYPSGYDRPSIVSVAATDANDQLAAYSNRGATTVDLAAPGSAVLSTWPGGGVQVLSGTSMAAPQVTGAAALIWGRFPALDALQVKARLLASVDTLASLRGACVTAGRLSLPGAIADPDSIPPAAVSDLAVVAPGSNTVDVAWTAPGDDGAVGRAAAYELRLSSAPFDSASFDTVRALAGPEPVVAGSMQTFRIAGLATATAYFLALRARDESGNYGPLSNVVAFTTLGPPSIGATPDSLEATLDVGGSTHRTLTLANLAEGTLDWSAPLPVLAFAHPEPAPEIALAKGEAGPAGSPVVQGRGGPDGAGYRWVDSDEPEGPTFAWEEPTPDEVLPLAGDDAISDTLSLGFAFPFYGQRFTTVRVCTNGFLSFTDTATRFSNQPLPGLGAPAAMVAPLWDDLDFGLGYRAYAHAASDHFTVTFVEVPHYGTGGPYTFQVRLDRGGEIAFHYLTLGAPLDNATVGIQSPDKGSGLQVVFDAPYLHDSLAVRIRQLPQWMTVVPGSGRVLAGGTQDLDVRLTATGLLGGTYRGSLRVDSNDPARPEIAVPVRLDVHGAPDVIPSPTALDFGEVVVGDVATRGLVIANGGTDTLHVASVGSDDPRIAATPGTFALGPGDARALVVRFAPDDTGPLAGPLTVASDDPDSPALDIPLAGGAVPAPDVRVRPDSVVVALASGDTTSRPLRIVNRGAGPYTFVAEALGSDPASPIVALGPGGPGALLAGGPDAAGYTFRDSDAPAGPAFAWDDVRLDGTRLDLSGDDARSAPVPIGFPFPFYGAAYDRLWVCTNGWISLADEPLATPANGALPSAADGVPAALLAPFWDDLVFGSERRAWVRSEADRCVIQFQDVPRFGALEATRPNTFEIVLHRDGAIEYRYLAVRAANPASATVGIQDATRAIGLQVAYDAAWLRDSLAVRFEPAPGWLAVRPGQGAVPPGDSLDLAVGFDARGRIGGDYRGAVRLIGNDPAHRELAIPCAARVAGVPAMEVDAAALELGTVFVGHPGSATLEVRNPGTDTLHVAGIRATDARVAVDPAKFALPARSARTVRVTWSPPGVGTLADTLALEGDAPARPRIALPLAGRSLEPPLAAASPGSLAAAAARGLVPAAERRERAVVLRNDGASPLAWSARAIAGPSILGAAAPGPAAKGAAEPSGARGAGGPDGFGYVWSDSDEPDGAPFAWVDLGATGEVLALDRDDQTLAGVRLPFTFPFYGAGFDSVNVCTNGWLSFTSTKTTYLNGPLPDTAAIVPENLIAAFWDDLSLDPSAGGGRVLAGGAGDRFAITFENVRRLDGAGPYTFQVVLQASGDIDLQYLALGGPTTGATAGIQDATRLDGLQVVWNAAYLHDRLRVRIARGEPWISVAPDSGAVAPGAADTLTVRFAAGSRDSADYRGEVRIATDDPDHPVLGVPCALHVGTERARLALDPARLSPALGGDSVRVRIEDAPLAGPLAAWVGGTEAAPRRAPDGAWEVGFPTLAARAEAARAGGVLTVAIEDGARAWVAATDSLRLLVPALAGPSPLGPIGGGADTARVRADTTLTLAWDAPEIGVTDWQVWLATDGGMRWRPLALGLATPRFEWHAPDTAVAAARIELTGLDRGRLVSSWVSDPFAVVAAAAPAPPSGFGLRLTSANPAPGAVTLELAVPVAARVEVEVLDVRGARVRRLAEGRLEPGRPVLGWDGRDEGGRRVPPGLYFVRARGAGASVVRRVVMLR